MDFLADLSGQFSQIYDAVKDKLKKPTENYDDIFFLLFCASTIKSLEYNIKIQTADEIEGFIYQPFLRGLAEDFIFLAYLETIEGKLRQDLIINFIITDIFSFSKKQKDFFQDIKERQAVVIPEMFPMDKRKSNKQHKKERAKIWKKLDWNKSDVTTRDIAEKVNMTGFYDYIYSATSRTVHFNPWTLMRQGCMDLTNEDIEESSDKAEPELNGKLNFSLENFSKYHSYFTRFYGAFIFVSYFRRFKELFPANKIIEEAVSSIEYELYLLKRWPEIITFEEFNISLEEGIHFFQFHKNPLTTTMLKGLPKHLKIKKE